MNKKSINNILYVIIAILSVFIIVLSVYTICITLQNNNRVSTPNNNIDDNDNDSNIKEPENNNVDENKIISKLDNTKDWVYDANYNLPTNKESYYGYTDHTKLISASDLVVPYININSDNAKKANDEIFKLYSDLINTFNENLKEEIYFTLVDYKTYIDNSIVSIIITTESGGTDVLRYKYYTYSFNLENGKSLSYGDVYKIAGFNSSNINIEVKKAITNVMEERLADYPDKTDFDTFNNESITNYKNSVGNNTLKYFLSSKGELNIIVRLSIPAGMGYVDEIITIR